MWNFLIYTLFYIRSFFTRRLGWDRSKIRANCESCPGCLIEELRIKEFYLECHDLARNVIKFFSLYGPPSTSAAVLYWSLCSGPEKIFSFLGAQISTSCLPGKPVIFDPFYAAKLNPYSSYNWAEIVFNPTLSPSTHPMTQLGKNQLTNIEHYMLNRCC